FEAVMASISYLERLSAIVACRRISRMPWNGPLKLCRKRNDERLRIRLADELDTDRQAFFGPTERKRDSWLAGDVEGIGEGNVGEVVLRHPLRHREEFVQRLRRESDRRRQ